MRRQCPWPESQRRSQRHLAPRKDNAVTDDKIQRLFTVEQANNLIPQLIPLLVTLRSNRAAALSVQQSLDELTPAMRGNGSGLRAVELEQELSDLVMRIAAGVREVARLGVVIKDLDHGLVDFPSRRDGRIVYLCWRLGEEQVAYWHETDSGFFGRQAL
jgi:hypothetical protein